MGHLLRTVGYRMAMLALGACTSFCAAPISAGLPLKPGFAAVNTMMPAAGAITFQNQSGYQSYHAGTLHDAKDLRFVRRARGEACQRGVGIPFAYVANVFFRKNVSDFFSADVRWGDGALNAAMAQAMQMALPDEVLVDITVDVQELSILSVVYRQRCLVVEGKVMAPEVRQPALGPQFDRVLLSPGGGGAWGGG